MSVKKTFPGMGPFAVRVKSPSDCLGMALMCLLALQTSTLAAAEDGASASAATKNESDTTNEERAGGPIGVGVALGDLDGISLKMWSGPVHAFHFRFGSLSQLNSLGVIATYEHHFRPIEVTDRTFSLPFYVGGGARLAVASNNNTYMDGGLLLVGGMTVFIPDLPVDLFFEIRPSIVLYDYAVGTTSDLQLGFILEGGLGAHYYF